MSRNRSDGRTGAEKSSGKSPFTLGFALLIGGVIVASIEPFLGIPLLIWGGCLFIIQLVQTIKMEFRERNQNIPQARSTSRPAQRFDLDAPDHNHLTAPPMPRINSSFPTTSSFSSTSPDHNHITSVSGHTKARELAQLETMLSAGLIEKDEYHMRKEKILARYS